MTRQADHTDVVSKIFAAELCSETDLARCFKQFLLQFHVAESMSELIALSGQRVQIFHRCLLHHLEILLGRSTTDHKRNVIRRTRGSAKSLHFLHQERHQSLGIDGSLGLLIEICLVGRAAALCHKQEMILVALTGVDVDLRRQITSGIDFVIHVQRSVLRIAQIVLCICLVDTVRQLLLVVASGPHLLPLGAVHNGSARVLTERQLALCGNLGVAQHRQSHIFVVCARFRIAQNLRYHLVVLATEHKSIVVGGLTCKHSQRFGIYHKHLVTVPVLHFHIIWSEQIILGSIWSERKHFLVFKRLRHL